MASCFPAEITTMGPKVQHVLETILAHEIMLEHKDTEDIMASFLNLTTEFGTDNRAMHHICNDITLFFGKIRKVANVGVKGVGGISEAVGVGTIWFRITNDNGISEEITLNNVIYLPDCPKNLISIM